MPNVPVTSTVANLRLWSTTGWTVFVSTYDASNAFIESFEYNGKSNTPLSLASMKGSGLSGTPVTAVLFSTRPGFVATVLSGPTEPSVPVALMKPSELYAIGTGYSALEGGIASAPSNFTPVTTAGTIDVKAGQEFCIQNVGTEVIYVKLGTGASVSSLNFELRPGEADDDGLGEAIQKVLRVDTTVSYAFAGGGSPKALAWKW